MANRTSSQAFRGYPVRQAMHWCQLVVMMVGLAVAGSTVAAEVYRCETASGEVTYSQFPCPEHAEEAVIAVKKTRQADVKTGKDEAGQPAEAASPIITERQLQGRWTDFPEGGAFASTWEFASPYLTFRKYSGVQVKARYTLDGNRLTVHHQPSPLNDQPWDEEMTIVRYDGDSLTWNWGINITIHRID